MKTNVGKVETSAHVPGKLFLIVEDGNGFRTCARLTPSQALRIAAQLQRWVWKEGES